jgi:predicted RNA-binding protein with PIN domain
MPYLIDGHNLIPKLGLRLDSPDDEMELIVVLQEFARLDRSALEVYFDGAPVGQAGTHKLGAVKAHFVRLGQTADAAIRSHLQKMGRAARNWIVVSSDREIQNAAHTFQAKIISSDEFAKLIKQSLESTPKQADKILSRNELDEWMRIFSSREGGEK